MAAAQPYISVASIYGSWLEHCSCLTDLTQTVYKPEENIMAMWFCQYHLQSNWGWTYSMSMSKLRFQLHVHGQYRRSVLSGYWDVVLFFRQYQNNYKYNWWYMTPDMSQMSAVRRFVLSMSLLIFEHVFRRRRYKHFMMFRIQDDTQFKSIKAFILIIDLSRMTSRISLNTTWSCCLGQ